MRNVERGYLNSRHFTYTLSGAALAHFLAFGVWIAVPKTPVVDIPVRVLNIKLGDGEDAQIADAVAAPQAIENSLLVERSLKRSFENVRAPAPKPLAAQPVQSASVQNNQAEEKPMEQAQPVSALESEARQFVRERAMPALPLNPAAGGSVVGNTDSSSSEALRRYEQLISAWIQRFKTYPDEARRQKMEGEGAVRIRIDRRGNVQYRIIERRTGYQLLDKAALDMVQAANPVPAVPADYPRQGELLEFVIPVSFKLGNQ